jgi:hypothetical protein
VDRSSLDRAQRRAATYQEEVVLLNDARADLLARLEERGDELRRMRAELGQKDERGVPVATHAGRLPGEP